MGALSGDKLLTVATELVNRRADVLRRCHQIKHSSSPQQARAYLADLTRSIAEWETAFDQAYNSHTEPPSELSVPH